MASLYHWLYATGLRLFETFGLAQAENIYEWRREVYLSDREAGEDVDLEGEVECADPAKVMPYIRESYKWKIKPGEINAAIQEEFPAPKTHAEAEKVGSSLAPPCSGFSWSSASSFRPCSHSSIAATGRTTSSSGG